MQIIISPAKKMKSDLDFLPPQGLPIYLERTERLLAYLKALPYQSLRKLLSCNDQIATLNFERFQGMDLCRNLTPALLAYEGIQYRYMAPAVFTNEELAYVQTHLRILSGFYGILRPFDGVTPYRLEMQARLKTDVCRNLYDFWGDAPAAALKPEGVLLDLASEEYSRAVRPHLSASVRVVAPVFGELSEDGRVVEKGVYVKMARGEMVRFLAGRGAEGPGDLPEFSALGFQYCRERSTPEQPVFLKSADRM